MRGSDRLLRWYIAAVAAAGVSTLVLLTVAEDWELADDARFWVLGACVVAGEIKPVRVIPRRRSSAGLATTSTTFAFALLLSVGPFAAASWLAAGSICSDLLERRAWYKGLFNLAQYALSIAAAAALIASVSDATPLITEGRVELRDVVPLAAAMVGYFIVNNLLTAVVIALSQRASLLRQITDVFAVQAPVDGLLLGMAPVVVVVADENLPLIAFLLLPVTAVYMTAKASLEKEHQALHDALTGLPNRVLFHTQATDILADGSRGDRAAVLLIDLDHFKEINDTLGHHVGDLVLREVGPRLQTVVRDSSDLVARLGGDEFAIFIEEIASVDAAEQVARRVLAALAEPFEVADLRLHLEASVGVALFPDHGRDLEQLLQRADVAMYLAKGESAGYQLYRPDRDPHSRRRLTLLSDLRDALDTRQLVLHFQPKVDIASGQVVDAETLVRWMHPDLGLVPPTDFVPLAERSGLIGPLTAYVLEEALVRCKEWEAAGHELRIAVNLSVRSLRDLDLPGAVDRLLRTTGMDPGRLALELTETTIMSDPVRAMDVLEPLSDMGVRLSVDDFGTGYSSLTYLRRLPISEIKIDRSFIREMSQSENDAIIVRSTVELGRNLGFDVVAEGVEDERTLRLLGELGCGYAQGYYISPPVPATDFLALPILRVSGQRI